MISSVLPSLFDQIKRYGAESIEVEFKLGKVSRHRFETIRDRVTKDSRCRPLAPTRERNEYNGTDARRVLLDDGRSFTMYKKRLMRVPVDEGNMDVSLERPGQPDTSARYTIFRDKDRVSFLINDVWRLDMTRIRTNDPRYAESDEELFEVELELVFGEMMFYYTLDYALRMGLQLFTELTRV